VSPAKPSAPAAEPVGAAEAAALLGPHLEAGALIAVSGGPDSMALLGLAAEAARSRGLSLPQAFTFDHGLRDEARAEAEMVARQCARLGIRHHLRRWPDPERPASGVHAAARLARYAAAIAVAQEAGCAAVLTAHHLDDQAETVLMRLARTCEPRALAGIEALIARPGYPEIARPFLGLPGARLAASLSRLGLTATEDPSNTDPAYERSRIRAAMPVLADAGIDAPRLAGLAAEQGRIARAIEAAADRVLEGAEIHDTGTIVLCEPLRLRDAAGPEVWRAALRRLLMAAGGTTASPGREQIEALDARLEASLSDNGSPLRLTLGGATIEMERDRLVLAREWGRQGPPSLAAGRGASAVFDGRHFVAPHPLAGPGTRIAGFGLAGRGGKDERTLPVLFCGTTPLAVPPLLAGKAPEGCRADLETEPLVGRRLADPHIGGLYDRLVVENRLPAATGRAHTSCRCEGA